MCNECDAHMAQIINAHLNYPFVFAIESATFCYEDWPIYHTQHQSGQTQT